MRISQIGAVGLEAPRDKGGKSAGFVLQLSRTHKMLKAVFPRIDCAVHHRDRGSNTYSVRRPHAVEPLIGCIFVGGNILPNLLRQYLRAAAGYGVEAGGFKANEGLFQREFADFTNLN